jgi:hypothetical protein
MPVSLIQANAAKRAPLPVRLQAAARPQSFGGLFASKGKGVD